MTYADLLFICVKDHTGCRVEKRFGAKVEAERPVKK